MKRGDLTIPPSVLLCSYPPQLIRISFPPLSLLISANKRPDCTGAEISPSYFSLRFDQFRNVLCHVIKLYYDYNRFITVCLCRLWGNTTVITTIMQMSVCVDVLQVFVLYNSTRAAPAAATHSVDLRLLAKIHFDFE